jgi:hypothetical protein
MAALALVESCGGITAWNPEINLQKETEKPK